MSDPAAAAGATGGVGLVLNATASAISSVTVTPTWAGGGVAAWTLFPATAPAGSCALGGCSFPIPPGGRFDITVEFDTGERPVGSVATSSAAAPAIVIVAFLNVLLVTSPTGAATQVLFAPSLAAQVTNFQGVAE